MPSITPPNIPIIYTLSHKYESVDVCVIINLKRILFLLIMIRVGLAQW